MNILKKVITILIITIFCCFSFNCNLKAEELTTQYFEDVYNTGKDNGYSKQESVKNGDPHYGWKLGKFVVSGFSSKRKDANGNWIFLKNVGDEITMYFNVMQDINKLDGNNDIKISDDKNGFDNEFNIKKTNFGKGTLIVRKIDPNGNKNEPKIYTNYLTGLVVGANTKIDMERQLKCLQFF